jgi:hypothetical protein
MHLISLCEKQICTNDQMTRATITFLAITVALFCKEIKITKESTFIFEIELAFHLCFVVFFLKWESDIAISKSKYAREQLENGNGSEMKPGFFFCFVCHDDAVPVSLGVCCEDNHFICWECFSASMKKMKPQEIITKKNKIACLYDTNCKKCFSIYQLIQKGMSEDIAHKLNKTIIDKISNELIRKQEILFEAKCLKEMESFLAIKVFCPFLSIFVHFCPFLSIFVHLF